VSKVLHCDAPLFERPLAEPMADLIVSLMGNYDAMVAPATTSGKNISRAWPPCSTRCRSPDITAVKSADTFERPIYAGNAIQTVQSTGAKKIDHGAHCLVRCSRYRRFGCNRNRRCTG
jgi:electron transfer flavoprotein alpha subunit